MLGKVFLNLVFASLFLWTSSSFAATVRILFRDGVHPISPEERSKLRADYGGRALAIEETFGHVAVELPPGTVPEGTIFGWAPAIPPGDSVMDVFDRLVRSNPQGRRNYTPGHFTNNSDWAGQGFDKKYLTTMALTFEVTPHDLRIIAANMENLGKGSNYQLMLDGSGFNCVSILPEVFKGTSVVLPEIPADGKMTTFVNANRSGAKPWAGSCDAAIASANP